MYRNVLHGVMKIFNINTLENVKGIESKIKSFSSFYHVALFNISHLRTMATLWQTSARVLTEFLHPHLNLTVKHRILNNIKANAQLTLMCNIRKESSAKNCVYMWVSVFSSIKSINLNQQRRQYSNVLTQLWTWPCYTRSIEEKIIIIKENQLISCV